MQIVQLSKWEQRVYLWRSVSLSSLDVLLCLSPLSHFSLEVFTRVSKLYLTRINISQISEFRISEIFISFAVLVHLKKGCDTANPYFLMDIAFHSSVSRQHKIVTGNHIHFPPSSAWTSKSRLLYASRIFNLSTNALCVIGTSTYGKSYIIDQMELVSESSWFSAINQCTADLYTLITDVSSAHICT